MTNQKSTATVMLAFFIVMASFLAFIVLVPDKTLIHWLGFMFILLAEFTFFIGNLFIQMLNPKTTHYLSKRLLLAYVFLAVVIALVFMLLKSENTKLLSIIQGGLFALTLGGLYYIGSKGKDIE